MDKLKTKRRDKIGRFWECLLMGIPGYNPFLLAGDCYFDREAARMAIDFFPECLVHIKGKWASSPFKLQPWEQSIVANLFGWKRPSGLRRYRTAFVFVPRKNGKTSFAAGIVIYSLITEDEPGAEIYSAAADRDQARLVFNTVSEMILNKKDLSRYFRVYRNSICRINPASALETGSSYKAISADANTKHGYNPQVLIVDELHAQRTRDLVEVLETGVGSRTQPIIFYITTSDYDRPSICNEKYDYACKVRDSIIPDDSFLPVIYEADRKDDWASPEIWRKANPNLGVSLFRDYLKRECKKAQEMPAYENTFKRLHLNIRTEQSVRWIPMELWDSNDDSKGAPSEEILKTKPCWGGLDLSSTTDLSAFVLVFEMEDRTYFVLPKIYVPADNARAREIRDKVPYLTWARQGFITLTPGNVVDYKYVKADVRHAMQNYNLQDIAFDRWNFEAIRQQLLDEDIPQDKMFAFGQGYISMSPACKFLMELLKSLRIRHSGNPVLRWAASNFVADMDAAENVKPNKAKSVSRIDPIVALIMALGRANVRAGTKPSIYETRGPLVFSGGKLLTNENQNESQ